MPHTLCALANVARLGFNGGMQIRPGTVHRLVQIVADRQVRSDRRAERTPTAVQLMWALDIGRFKRKGATVRNQVIDHLVVVDVLILLQVPALQ